MIKAYTFKQKENAKNIILQAYYTAALSRTKKMPKLDKLLNDLQKKESMSAEKMLETVKALNASLGGDIIE